MESQFNCFNDEQLFQITDRLYQLITEKHGINEPQWVSKEDAMKMLNCSKGTLQKLRDTMQIRFSAPPNSTIIMYDRASIMEYLDKNAQNTIKS